MNVKWEEQWGENFSLVFIVLGFMVSVLLRSSILSYFSIFLAGLLAGRMFYIKHVKEPILPFFLMIIGFLLGYLLGAIWVSRFLALILFIVAFGSSYYLHLKKIFVIFKSERFIK